jgi:hypothetical protein
MGVPLADDYAQKQQMYGKKTRVLRFGEVRVCLLGSQCMRQGFGQRRVIPQFDMAKGEDIQG